MDFIKLTVYLLNCIDYVKMFCRGLWPPHSPAVYGRDWGRGERRVRRVEFEGGRGGLESWTPQDSGQIAATGGYVHAFVLPSVVTECWPIRTVDNNDVDYDHLDMVNTSPWTLSWCEFPIIQSVKYSTSLLRNFISCLNVRSSRLIIIASTSWQTFVLIWIAWIVESRCRTYLAINQSINQAINQSISVVTTEIVK